MAAMLACANMITEWMMIRIPIARLTTDNGRTTVLQATVGYARAKGRRVIKELQDTLRTLLR